MKPVLKNEDYLDRLKNSESNIREFLTTSQIKPGTDLGQSFLIALDLFNEEIEKIKFIRQF